MADTMYLVGSEDVSRAGNSMRNAAEEMSRAAANIEGVMERHQRFMDDWLERFTQVLENDFQRKARS